MATRPPFDYPAAAAYTGSSERKLRELVTAGRLPHVRLGRKVRFLPDSIDAWLAAQEDIGDDLRRAALPAEDIGDDPGRAAAAQAGAT